MAFLEERISIELVRGAGGGPRMRRTKNYTQSGRLQQIFEWEYALRRYDLKYGIKLPEQVQELLDFWMVVMQGAYSGFRVRDLRDFEATAANSSLALVSGTTWQLRRTYTAGSASTHRPIYKPSDDVAVVVYDAGNSVLTGSTDYTTGRWTGTGTPAYWTGIFDVPVAFENDDDLAALQMVGRPELLVEEFPSVFVEELLQPE